MNVKNLKYMLSMDDKIGRFRICLIMGEDADNYIGNWASGFGEMRQKFPKKTTRDLTEGEIKDYQTLDYCKTKKLPFALPITSGGRIKLKKSSDVT